MAFIYDMVDEWNNGATTFTAIKMDVTDTASASGSLLMDLQVASASKVNIDKLGALAVTPNTSGLTKADYCFIGEINTGMKLSGLGGEILFLLRGTQPCAIRVGQFAVNDTLGLSANVNADSDVKLVRDAANILAQRNSTNAQTFRVYGTFTDASNYERFQIVTQAGGDTLIRTIAAGTGTVRNLAFGTNANSRLIINDSTGNVELNTNLTAASDNTYDIGASGASRPRNLYVGTTIRAVQFVYSGNEASGSGYLGSTGLGIYDRLIISAPSDGVMLIRNNGINDFNRIQFGGTTSSFPALKRNSAVLETKLADDSAYAQHKALFFGLVDGVTAPTTTSGTTFIYVDTADGDLKVRFGDGFTAVIAADS